MNSGEWSKRLTVIFGGIVLVAVSVVGRLYQKTVINHPQSVKAASEQYAFRKEVIGQRGAILVKDDETYFPLAENERRYQVLAIPINITDPAHAAKALAPKLGLDEAKVFETINNKKLYVPPLKRRLTRQEADDVAGLKLSGVLLLPELVRTYPEQSLAAQVLGFVNAEDKGNYGVEGTFDAVLKGSQGYQVGEKDNKGRLITLDDEVKAKNGTDIVLTIDRDIQHYVEQALEAAVKKFEADSGSVIIVTPKTGAIVAMASVPEFNPNEFNKVDDPAKFINPTISSVWEPGSIAKPLVMALAVDKGLVEPDTKGTFGASVHVLNHEIFTAEKKAFGEETMTQVLENSDNVAMVWLADKLGSNDLREGLQKFGFGDVPALKLQSVISGFLPPLKNWNDLTRATSSFGQGFSTTPLQMVMAYAALANDGVLMNPYLVSEVRDDVGVLVTTQPKEVRRVVSSETARKLTTMLESVVDHGHAKRAGVPGFRVGGKTGTAQVPNPQGGYYDDRHVGSLSGSFPLSDPQYSMVVKIDNPKNTKFAESSAGPTFGEIAQWILVHNQIKPDKP